MPTLPSGLPDLVGENGRDGDSLLLVWVVVLPNAVSRTSEILAKILDLR